MRISDWSSDVCASDLPTPRKLNQNPGASTASGSTSSTAVNASANVDAVPAGRRSRRASSNTPIINRVRTVGKAKPAAAVYRAAMTNADIAAACGRGQYRPNRGHSQHASGPNNGTTPATRAPRNHEKANRGDRPGG